MPFNPNPPTVERCLKTPILHWFLITLSRHFHSWYEEPLKDQEVGDSFTLPILDIGRCMINRNIHRVEIPGLKFRLGIKVGAGWEMPRWLGSSKCFLALLIRINRQMRSIEVAVQRIVCSKDLRASTLHAIRPSQGWGPCGSLP